VVGSEHEREAAAEAEADDAGLAGALVSRGEPGAHGVEIGQQMTGIAHRREQASPPPLAVEQIRRDGEEAFGRKPVGLAMKIVAHPKRIMNNDDAGPRPAACRQTEVGRYLTPSCLDAHVHLAALRGRWRVQSTHPAIPRH
jgi:hypothetical protein